MWGMRTYSKPNHEYSEKKSINFPHKKEIQVFFVLGYILVLVGGFLSVGAANATCTSCVPTERLEPCEFKGKLSLDKIFSMKKEINEIQRKINEITNVMNYGLSKESSATLIQKQNSINETLEKLLEKFNFQKRNFEKCYFENFEICHNNRVLLSRIMAITFCLSTICCFLITYCYIRNIPVPELNDEQKESYNDFFIYLGIMLLFCCCCVPFFFIKSFEKVDEIGDIPIFVAEIWRNKCDRYHVTITVDEYLAQK